MYQLQNQSLRTQKQSHSQVQYLEVGGREFVSQVLLLIVAEDQGTSLYA